MDSLTTDATYVARTTAELIAAELEDDGLRWETRDGQTLAELCDAAGARLSYAVSERDDEARVWRHREVGRSDARDLVRYGFADGSAIVAADGAWDVEGPEPFSWAGSA